MNEINLENTSNDKDYCKYFVFERNDVILRVDNIDKNNPIFNRPFFYKDERQINFDANRVIGIISLRLVNKKCRPLYVFSDGDTDTKLDKKYAMLSREGTRTFEQIDKIIVEDVLEDGSYLTTNNDKKIYLIRDIILEKAFNLIDDNENTLPYFNQDIIETLNYIEALDFAIKIWNKFNNEDDKQVIKNCFYQFIEELTKKYGSNIEQKYKNRRRFDLTAQYDEFYEKINSFIKSDNCENVFKDFVNDFFINNKIIKNENKLKKEEEIRKIEKEKLLLLLKLKGTTIIKKK